MKRGGSINQFLHAPDSMCVSRPCSIPTEAQARASLARDLSRTAWVVQDEKMGLLPSLPLFLVALDGHEGLFAAVMLAAQRKAA